MFRQRRERVGRDHRRTRSWWVRLTSIVAPVALAAASMLHGAAPAAAHHLVSPQRGAGYVWASNPTASHTPSPQYSENTSNDGWGPGQHGSNTVTRTGVGTYTVRYPNLGVVGGTVQVTAYGTGTEQCKVSNWLASGMDQLAGVRCFTLSGSPVDSRFVASFTNYNSGIPSWTGGSLAYLWANQPTATSAYVPSETYQFNSAGPPSVIKRSQTGVYRVYLQGVWDKLNGGHIQVTGYGFGSERCKVAGWGASPEVGLPGYGWLASGTVRAEVRCFTAGGAPADSRFTLTFADRENILGADICCHSNGRLSAYGWASQPTSPSYTLPSAWSWNGWSGWAEGTRHAEGSYAVQFYSGFSGAQYGLGDGHVNVTAYGTGPEFCKVAWWGTSSGAAVRCFDASGAPVDTRFTIAYTGNWILG